MFIIAVTLYMSGCTHIDIRVPPGDLPKLDVHSVVCDSAEIDVSSREFVINCTILI